METIPGQGKTTNGIRNIILMFCQTQLSPITSYPALRGQRTRIMTDRPIRNENSSYPTADRTPTHAHTQRLWGQIFQRCTQQQCQHSRLYILCVIIAPKCEQDSLPYLYCSSGALAMAHSQHSSSRDGFHSWIKVCSCSCSSLVMTGIYILIYIRGNYFTYWFTYNNANMYLKWHFLHLFLLRQWVVAQFPQTITYHKRKLHFNLPHSMWVDLYYNYYTREFGIDLFDVM